MEGLKKKSDFQLWSLEKVDFEEPEGTKPKKQHTAVWSSRRKTLQSYITITLGLGHMMKFAAAISLYGGIMWIPYIAWGVLVGIPIVTAELALAHYVNNDMNFLWEMCPIGKGVFYNCFIATFIATMFSHFYLTHLLHLTIDYNISPHLTATDRKIIEGCYGIISPEFYGNGSTKIQNITHGGYCRTISFTERHCLRLGHSGSRSHVADEDEEWFSYIYLGLINALVLVITSRGVRSLEKVNYTIPVMSRYCDRRFFTLVVSNSPQLGMFTTFLVLVPYFCAATFVILTLTLPRSVSFLGRSLKLNWSKLKEFSVWLWSFEHVVSGFAIGTLCFTFVSVHRDFHDDIMIDAITIFMTDFLSTVLLSLILLGLFGTKTNEHFLDIEGLPMNDYLDILLCTIEGLGNLPPPKYLWSLLFFTYLLVSKIGAQSFMVASVADAIMTVIKKFKASTFLVTAGLSFTFYALGCAMLYLEIDRLPFLDMSFITIGLLQSATLFWIYNYQRVCADFHFLMGYKPSLFYQFVWVLSPLVFLGFIIAVLVRIEPEIDLISNNAILLVSFHFGVYILCGAIACYRLWAKGENYNIFRSNESWGPSDPILRKSRLIFNSRIITGEHIYRQKLYKKQLVKPFDITDQNIVQLQ